MQADAHRDMVDAWLKAHGGPRRFRTGDSTDLVYLQNWLYQRGYLVFSTANAFFVRVMDGKPKRMRRRELIAFVDKLRASEGLKPIVKSR